jgi:hypothetical protein
LTDEATTMNLCSTQAAEPTLSGEADISGLVRELRGLYYASGVELMIRIGELIFERIYCGDEGLWRAKHKKDHSFRKLQQHPDLPFKASMLSRSVAVYMLSRRRRDLLELRYMGPSHLQEVLRFDAARQDELIEQVERERWSVQRLRDEIAHLPARKATGGRPRKHAFVRRLMQIAQVVERRELVVSTEALTSLDRKETAALLATAQRLCHQAEAAARVLSRHLATLKRGHEELPQDPRSSSGVRLSRVTTAQHPGPDIHRALPLGENGASSP